MKILVADALHGSFEEAMEQEKLSITVRPDLSSDQLSEAIADHNVLVVRSTRVDADVLKAATNRELVIRAGAGTNTIDVEAAGNHGVYVANCPGKNAIAVAELTWAMVLGLDRQLALADRRLRAGRWEKKRFSKARGLHGQTFGIVGFGNIGRAVAHRAAAMGMKVVAWSRSLTPEVAKRAGVRCMNSLEELAEEADVVSIHLPKAPATQGLLGEGFFDSLRDGTLVVNVSRGGVVDEAIVKRCLTVGKIKYATDVFTEEPASGEDDFNNELLEYDETLCTPHIGAATTQAQKAVADEVRHIICSYKETGLVPNVVNLRPPSMEHCQIQVRHRDRVGVLAKILTKIREADINIEDMTNAGFSLGHAACATITLNQTPSHHVLHEVGAIPDVLGVSLRG